MIFFYYIHIMLHLLITWYVICANPCILIAYFNTDMTYGFLMFLHVCVEWDSIKWTESG